MKKLTILVGMAAVFACQTTPKKQPTASPVAARYKQFCASCHGEKVEPFVDREWKNGGSRAEIIKSIASGNLEKGMPAFNVSFKTAEIEALADYLLAAVEKGKKYGFEKAERPKTNLFKTQKMTVLLDTVLSGAKNPWGMTFLPNGDLLYTERGGQLFRLSPGGKPRLVGGTPEVHAKGQGGLLDVELHPKFSENKLIYLSYSKPRDSAGVILSTTAILRARLEGEQLLDSKDIFVAKPWSKNIWHFGCRLVFDREGYLFFGVGERGEQYKHPQSLNSDCGKIHRIFDDGRIPPDNPFAKSHPENGSIWSWGHRNPQGLCLHPTTGELWEHEHGPRGGDEINLIKPGKNYGWPVISYGINYDGTVFTNLTEKEGMEQPLKYFVPSIAPSGLAFVPGKNYPAWAGDLLMGSLRFQYLNRCDLEAGKIVGEDELLFQNIGRLRCVKAAPDGFVYIAVEEPGFIFKLVPIQ